jgi:hypothetical protein
MLHVANKILHQSRGTFWRRTERRMLIIKINPTTRRYLRVIYRTSNAIYNSSVTSSKLKRYVDPPGLIALLMHKKANNVASSLLSFFFCNANILYLLILRTQSTLILLNAIKSKRNIVALLSRRPLEYFGIPEYTIRPSPLVELTCFFAEEIIIRVLFENEYTDKS